MNIEVTALSIPTSALSGASVPISVTLKSLVAPASMYAMRARAAYTKYPDDGTAPVSITLNPSSEVNDVTGEVQAFVGSFTMPAYSVTVEFSIEYQAAAGGDWVSESTQSGVVSLTETPSEFDWSGMTSMIMMIVMMGFMYKIVDKIGM